jgi:hypothetical protein
MLIHFVYLVFFVVKYPVYPARTEFVEVSNLFKYFYIFQAKIPRGRTLYIVRPMLGHKKEKRRKNRRNEGGRTNEPI